MLARVLILGSTGMLGHVLLKELSSKKDLEVFGTTRKSSILPGQEGLNVLTGIRADNLDSVRDAIVSLKPHLLINSIGIIKQLNESRDPVTCISINALFPHQVAHLCREAKVRMIHISTDCVFSGRKGEYTEDDPSDADDLYGRTKFLGEVTYPNCVTLRTSIIGHEIMTHFGLIEWFLSQNEEVNGYAKAIYSGFPTVELTRILYEYVMPDKRLEGLYHVSSSPISKFDLLKIVAEVYERKISIEPSYVVNENKTLNSTRFRELTGYKPPAWHELVTGMRKHFLENAALYNRRNP